MKYIGKIGSVTNTFVHCRDGQFYYWRKPECPEKTIDLSQVKKKGIMQIKMTKRR